MHFYSNYKIKKNAFTTKSGPLWHLEKVRMIKATHVNQVIEIRTNSDLSKIYFLGLQLLYRWSMLVSSQSLKIKSMQLNF